MTKKQYIKTLQNGDIVVIQKRSVIKMLHIHHVLKNGFISYDVYDGFKYADLIKLNKELRLSSSYPELSIISLAISLRRFTSLVLRIH